MQTNIYYFNFADAESRKWDDHYPKNQLSIMPISNNSMDALDELQVGDVFAVYRKGVGYHGLARCKNKPSKRGQVQEEYVIGIEWIKEFNQPKNESKLFKSMIPMVKLDAMSVTASILFRD